MFEMLTYKDIASNIGPNIMTSANKIEFEGFTPNIEFSSNVMDYILSEDYINVNFNTKRKNKETCCFPNCLRIARRNSMCKIHIIYVFPQEKCNRHECDNLKCFYKNERHHLCEKHRTNNIKKKQAVCSINNCKKLAKRNEVCKTHNLAIYPLLEKCKKKGCNNLKDFTKKNRDQFCYKHK